MNDWDRDNLNFLMSIGDAEFTEWMMQADSDDIEYAVQLIRQARTELMVEEMELEDSLNFYERKCEFPEAMELIEKIKKL